MGSAARAGAPRTTKRPQLRNFPSPTMRQTITAPVSDATSTTTAGGTATPVLGPTPAEVQRSAARNRSWKREQERLQPTRDGSSQRTESEPGEESPY